MIYEYRCGKGCAPFDVVKSYRHMEDPEHCPKCGELSTRQFVPSKIHLVGTQVTHAEYNPGLGCIVKSKAHKRDLMKAKGLEEVGNASVESIHKHFDTNREEKIDRAYDEATKGWVGNGE